MTPAPDDATGATLVVDGVAAVELEPDRFIATAHLRSAVVPAAPAAMAEVAALRRDLLDHLAARHPAAELADDAIAVREHVVHVEADGRSDVRVEGVYAVASVTLEVPAVEAAAAVASIGAFPGTARLEHGFALDPAREAAARLELAADAIRDARRRAVVLAAAADLAVRGIVAIGEEPTAGGEQLAYAMAKGAFFGDDGDALLAELGELRPEPVSLEERVRVRFRLG